MGRLLCSRALPPSPRAAYEAAVAAGRLTEDSHQVAAITLLEQLHGELRVWRPPPPPPPPPPPKESKWKGPALDAYGEPIGGGTFYTGVKNAEEGPGLWERLSGMLSGGSAAGELGEGQEPELDSGIAAPKGLYLYGGSGCGKSMLIDDFLAPSIVAPPKAAASWVRRVHLHEFLLEVHQRAHRMRQETPAMGDPTPYLAYELLCETQVLLLDEVAVTDVADALMMRKLFRRLFHAGMVVVATSNRAPDELYLNGLQRPSFVPFISDVEQRCTVHQLGSGTDYRALATEASGVASLSPDGLGTYLHPLGDATSAQISSLWGLLTDGQPTAPQQLALSGRSLAVPDASSAAAAARFSFGDVCGQPLGAEDYLTLAAAYGIVVIEGVPRLTLSHATELRRLIVMVDALYDANVLLVLSADAPMESLFAAEGSDSHADQFGDVIGNIVQNSGDEAFAWSRTLSRLREMRSEAYVSRARRRKGLKQAERRGTALRLQQMAEQGGFDFAAFAELCQQRRMEVPEPRLKELFDQADADHSGKIDGAEVDKLISLLSADRDMSDER